jgi:basic membrane protein A
MLTRRALMAAAASALVAGCAPAVRDSRSVRIGMVSDLGGLGDHSYNDSAYAGLLASRDQLHVAIAILQSRSAADYQPNLTLFASKGYDQIFSVGYDQAPDLVEVAQRFPNRRFAIIDSVVDQPNVTSVTFKSAEGSFLAGALGALVSKTNTLGFLGGVDIALIREFEVGYIAGAHTVNPAVRVLSKYVGDFNDVATGKELSALMYGQGADIVYAAAGKAGLGTLQEVRERPDAYAIGVDQDQDALIPGKILTSVLKRIDNSVLLLAQLTARHLPRPAHLALGLKERGVGLTDFRYSKAVITPAIVARLNRLSADVIAGRIAVPATRAALAAYVRTS